MSQLFPLFEEESSNGDCASGLFSHLNFRLNDGFQSITIHENKFEPKDISSQLFERELPIELNEGKIKCQKKRETFKKKCIRKAKPDDIRKKIKARFHKVIKNIINANLKKVGSTKLFDFFPQNFVANITVKLNKIALNHTFEYLIKNDLVYQYSSQNQNQTDLKKFKRNLDVLDYLDNNPIIDQLSYFNKIRKMKYKDLYKAYFLSAEFEKSIIDMYKKGEKMEYIESYINKSLNFINFFMSFKQRVKKCVFRINNESDTGEQDSQEN